MLAPLCMLLIQLRFAMKPPTPCTSSLAIRTSSKLIGHGLLENSKPKWRTCDNGWRADEELALWDNKFAPAVAAKDLIYLFAVEGNFF